MTAEMAKEMTACATFTVLQWGRDQTIADMLSQVLADVATAKLQWGRDRTIAEMVVCGEVDVTDLLASMGPRPDDRGNSPFSTHHSSKTWRRSRERPSKSRPDECNPLTLLFSTLAMSVA